MIFKRRAGAVALCAALATLASCAVGPDYQRPGLALPDDYGTSASSGDSLASIPNQWWKLYNDEQLNDLMAAALTNNPDIRLAIARIDEARGALRETNAALFPEVDLAGTGARQRLGVAGGSTGAGAGGTVGGSGTLGGGGARYGNFFQLNAQLSYEIDLWGRLRRATESARAVLLSSSYARDVTALTLAGTTAQSYFALRALEAQIAVTNSTLTRSANRW